MGFNGLSDNITKLRTIARKLIRNDFKEPWDFKLIIAGAPEGFDLYCKDMSFGPIEIETEAIKAGSVTLTYPEGTSPTTISLTMRDHIDSRVYKWFTKIAGKVANKDGTFNLPNGYLLEAELQSVVKDGSVTDSWLVFPQKMGDLTQSVDAQGFLEFPLTFIQFRSSCSGA